MKRVHYLILLNIFIASQIFAATDVFDIKLIPTHESCPGKNDGKMTLSINGTGPFTMRWSFKDTIIEGTDKYEIYNLEPNRYYVKVTNLASGEVKIANDSVKLASFSPSIKGRNILCVGDTLSLTAHGGTQYQWNYENKSDSTINLTVNNANLYKVTVTNANNCTQTVEHQVNVFARPTITKVEPVNNNCYNDAKGIINIYPSTKYTYQWEDGIQSWERKKLKANDYKVKVISSDCSFDTILTITEPPQIKLSAYLTQPICPTSEDGSITILLANFQDKINGYIWSNNSQYKDLKNIKEGVYNLTVRYNNECTFDTSFTLTSLDGYCLKISTAFTPNGDGFNDKWTINNLQELSPNAKIMIFNREGVMLLSSIASSFQGWDGKYNNLPVPSDSYYYVIDFQDKFPIQTGQITVIR